MTLLDENELQHLDRQKMTEFGLMNANQNQRCSRPVSMLIREFTQGVLGVDSELEPEPLPWSSQEGKAQTKLGTTTLNILDFSSRGVAKQRDDDHVFALVAFVYYGLVNVSLAIRSIQLFLTDITLSSRKYLRETKCLQHWPLSTIPKQMKLNK